MSKYNVDLDYAILDIDISREELEEIKAEADRIISENKESNENLAMAYLKKAQCIRKLGSSQEDGFIFYEDGGILFLYEEEGEFVKKEDLKNLLEKALELSPDMPEAFMQLGLLNRHSLFGLRAANEDEAKDWLSKAIQQKPDYAAAFNNRAMLYYNSTIEILFDKDKIEKDKINYKNAVADLTEAIKIWPFDAIYYLNRGVFHSRLGEHKEAIEDFSGAMNNASDVLKDKLKTDVLILNLRGKEYLELKEYSKAIEDFSDTLRLGDNGYTVIRKFSESKRSKPGYVDTFLVRGKAYYLAGEKDKAKADFEEYLNRKCNIAVDENRAEVFEYIGVKPEDIF